MDVDFCTNVCNIMASVIATMKRVIADECQCYGRYTDFIFVLCVLAARMRESAIWRIWKFLVAVGGAVLERWVLGKASRFQQTAMF